MKRLFTFALGLALCCINQSAQAQTTALDKAEKHLTELLAPGAKVSSFATQPVQWRAARDVEDISLPLQTYTGVPVRLLNAPIKPVKPGAVREGQPLVYYREQSIVPKDVELPTKPLLRLPSVDVHKPLPIPILAQPQKDRATLADPTLEASLDAAMKPVSAQRTQPVPFTPLNLPDPFEYLRSGQLRNPPDENPMPPVIPLTKPTK